MDFKGALGGLRVAAGLSLRYRLLSAIMSLLVWIGSCQWLAAQDLNFKTTLFQNWYSDEQWPGSEPTHPGYTVGLDVLIPDGVSWIIPGLHYQHSSIAPQSNGSWEPYKKFPGIHSLKMPLQLGLSPFKNRFLTAIFHGGLAANYLMSVDENDRFTEDDFNDLRGSWLAGVTIRVLFLTAHIQYEHGLSRIYRADAPSGIEDKSRDRIFSLGIGVYF
jgi:hypothetical protein